MDKDKQQELDSIMGELGFNQISVNSGEAKATDSPTPKDTEGSAKSFAVNIAYEDEETPQQEQAVTEEAAIAQLDPEDEDEPVIHRKKRKKSSKNKLAIGLMLAVVIISISVMLAVVIIVAARDMLGIDKLDKNIDVTIPQSASTAQIASILQENGIINQPLLFRLYSRVKNADGTYQYGVFTLNPKMSYEDIVTNLQEISVVKQSIRVTIPEGYNIMQVAALMEEKKICTAKDFIHFFNMCNYGYDFEAQIPNDRLRFYKMEGYLFPDTYDFYESEQPENIMRRIFDNFNAKISEKMYARMKELDMTLDQVLTLASIVQAEASVKQDAGQEDVMKKVASVFYNRLKDSANFPMLQSDPTKKYVEEMIKPTVTEANYSIYEDTFLAYNTYEGKGLPPGPICNPGLQAINAVLYPEDTPYYFFCSNLETHEFFYAKTDAEHESNLRKAKLK